MLSVKKWPGDLIDKEIYPKFYFCQRGVSDRDWILSRMTVVPEAKKKEIAKRYEHLFLNKTRKDANYYLNNEAKKYI